MRRLRLPRALRAHHLDHGPRELTFFFGAAAALAFAGVFGVSWAAGFRTVLDRLLDVDWRWFLPALAGVAASYVGYIVAYREVARVDSGPELALPELGAVVSAGFGLFIPRGGFALDVEALGGRGIPEREARMRVFALGALEYALLAPAALVCAALLVDEGRKTEAGLGLSWLIGVPVGTVLALTALRLRDRIDGPAFWRRGAANWLDGIRLVFRVVAQPRDHGVPAFAGMALYWAGDIFALGCCIAAYRHGFPATTPLILGYATGYALTRRTLPLAGAGAVEALLPYALLWVGQPLPASVLAVFAYRVFNLWLPFGPALAGLLALRRAG